MKLGAVLPTDDLPIDARALRDFAQGLEDLGYDHISVFDHVVNASSAHYDRESLKGPYREDNVFRDPFVLFGFLSGVTRRLGFATNVLVLPQRQTVLVAKQAAEVDLLSGGGRLRLGIGSGWNHVEYESLGMPWADRGALLDEQITVLRKLWTEPLVEFEGRFHTIRHAGLNPLPLTRPIPIWLGGMSEPVIRRVGRTADGWMPMFPQLDGTPGAIKRTASWLEPEEGIARVRTIATKAGRDPESIGLEGRITHAGPDPERWRALAQRYDSLGFGAVTVMLRPGLVSGVDAALTALAEVRSALE